MTRKFAHDVVLSEKKKTEHVLYIRVMYMDGCVCVSGKCIKASSVLICIVE